MSAVPSDPQRGCRVRVGLLVLCGLAGASCSAPTQRPKTPLFPISKQIIKQIVPGSGRDPVSMALIAAGATFRGSAAGVGEEDERPRRLIFVSAFQIDQYEVSVGSYRRCVEDGTCSAPNVDENCNWRFEDREAHPVNCVSWYQAQKYCAWAGKRLPTEAEWEKAARGIDERLYSWGNEKPSCRRSNFNASTIAGKDAYCHGQTVPVSEYAGGASPYGAVQMTGNVYEWVQDWYGKDYYAASPERDPQGPPSGKHRVVRGGSWFSLDKDMRIALRGLVPPAIRLPYIGFRCARSLSTGPTSRPSSATQPAIP